MSRVAVVGASGFVGSAVVRAAEAAGHEVVKVSGFRIDPSEVHPGPGDRDWQDAAIDWLCHRVEGADAVINCAGDPDSLSKDAAGLSLANSSLPLVIRMASTRAAVGRFVHLSSAAVQGTLTLDDTPRYDAPSPYAASKMAGELAILQNDGVGSVVFRPPSVHDADRRITRILTKWSARGVLAVEAPGDRPTPQALLRNVADAVVTVACTPTVPPPIVAYPWEGTTVAGLLQSLGGRKPRMIPRPVSGAALRFGNGVARLRPAQAPRVRRLELLTRGQAQSESWLTTTGWTKPLGLEAWDELGREVRRMLDD